MFSPPLIGYYRGNFRYFGIKEFHDNDSWNDFLEKNSDFALDVLPNINFEKRQLIVASSKGPHLLGLFKVTLLKDSRCRIVLRKILQNDDIVGTTSAVLLKFPKNYKMSVLVSNSIPLHKLEPNIPRVKARIDFMDEVGETAQENGKKALVQSVSRLRESFLRNKAELEWTAVYRYCGYSLEEEDMFNYIPS